MATYNGATYIQEQLDSIARQIFLPYELVVCDDNSTDNTVEIIRTFANTAYFPIYIYQNEKNIGFANNFLKCVNLCKGNWVAFSDQDDIWLPEKLLKVSNTINNIQSDELCLVCHSADLVTENLTPIGRRLPDFKYNQVKRRNSHYGFLCIAGFATIFKAELLSQIDSGLRPHDYNPDEKCLSHDKWIAMLANTCGKIAYISESLVLYRRHSLACSGMHDKQSVIDRITRISLMGINYYKFQSDVAKESADSFRKISTLVCDKKKKGYLLVGAKKFDMLAKIYEFRTKLYESKKTYSKLKYFFLILLKRGYWGSHFYSLGIFSFLKDFKFIIHL